ncbi:MAG: NF038122 family metalloprotease [Candidatus Eremiobacteraeota bacterium]|nr:NF038122 family metalloprotease [Candidatus Eremiobacteraeota bacterium]
MRHLFWKSLVTWMWISAVGAGALPIVLRDQGGAAPGTQAGDAFALAAARVGALFTDPVTVYIDIGYGTLAGGVLGETNSNLYDVFVDDVRSALVIDQTSFADNIAAANLGSGPLQMFTNAVNGAEYFDNNNTYNNNRVAVTQANLRALGIDVFGAASDASITFSNAVNWDFNPDDGIAAGSYDFVGVAMHEILHTMGFSSGVTDIDYYTGVGPGAGQYDIDGNYWYRLMDLYRYRAPGVRDLAFGGTPYFSIDGGTTNSGAYSTGEYNGDGQQPSHWKDGLGLGLMDPTLGTGERGTITARDLLAMDVIGWDLAVAADAPELDGGLATMPVTIAGLSLLIGLGRRRRS